MKHWYHVDLSKEHTTEFRIYMAENRLKFELSENGNLTHVAVNMDENEQKSANDFLKKLN